MQCIQVEEVPTIAIDEMIRVLDDRDKVMSLQLSAGIEWTEDTCDVSEIGWLHSAKMKVLSAHIDVYMQCLGKVGVMNGADNSGVLRVAIGCNEYMLSPLCVMPESSNEEGGKQIVAALFVLDLYTGMCPHRSVVC